MNHANAETIPMNTRRAVAPLVVGDLMSNSVHWASPDDTLAFVHSMMRVTRTRHVPVVDRGRLVGIISDRDVRLAWSQGPDTPASRIMHRDPWRVHPDTPALVAADLMLHRKIGALPVVDADLALVGMVTETDFLQLARRALLIQSATSY